MGIWSMAAWGLAGWILSSSFFYILKYYNPDRGNCFLESKDLLFSQLSEGFSSNFSNLHGECYFDNDFYAARTRFLKMANELDSPEILDLPLKTYQSASQSIVIIRGNPKKFLVHLSGTHGVEGYSGSAIQSAALAYLKATKLYSSSNSTSLADLPTIIFIHAVNPYGFANNRRTNENNVDLNRNWLTDKEFEFVKNRDPNYSRYTELDHLLNPKNMPSRFVLLNDLYWLGVAGYASLKFGFVTIKRAMVAGNYHKQTGYGYGGEERQSSVENILSFFQKEKLSEKAKAFYVLDIHTGLGPSGVDTLLFDHVDGDNVAASANADWLETIFPTEVNTKGKIVGGLKSFSFGNAKPHSSGTSPSASSSSSPSSVSDPKATNKDAAQVGAGYDLTVGTTHAICETFVGSHLSGKNRLCIAQEFGTWPTFFVGKVRIDC
jgi:hypothetical protein